MAISIGSGSGTSIVKIAETNLTVAGPIDFQNLTPYSNYIIMGKLVWTGGAANLGMTFNADGGNNYTGEYAAASNVVASAFRYIAGVVAYYMFYLHPGAGSSEFDVMIHINNPASAVKTISGTCGNDLYLLNHSGKWSNAAQSISRITLKGQGSDDFGIGSNLAVYGFN